MTRKREREAALDQQRRAQRVVVLEAARAAVGDRAREQLLDRPVDHRDGHEQHRPQQRDLLVLDVVEDVGRDREVRERHDPREGDADREDAGAAAVAGARGPGQSRTSSIVHGNGERASTTSPWRLEQRDERALGPVVDVPGGVAEVLDVGAARDVEPAPQRLARHRDEQPALGHARHLRDRVRGVGDVLEHLDRGRDVELVVGERQVLRLHDPVLEVGRLALLPLGLDRGILEVEPDDAPRRELLRPLVGEDRLAAADVEQRLRVGLR